MFNDKDARVSKIIDGQKLTTGSTGTPYGNLGRFGQFGFVQTPDESADT